MSSGGGRLPRHRGLAIAASAGLVFAGQAHGQTEPSDESINEPGSKGRLELEAGTRAQGKRSYRGFYCSPGVWFEVPTGMELGLFAPLHLRAGDRGRNGIDTSFGLEPRFRFVIAEYVRGELAFGIAAEEEEKVHGIFSYSAGLNFNDVISLRFTHERYRLDDASMAGDASANYIDIAFTGRTGAAVAVAEVALVILLIAVTGGAP